MEAPSGVYKELPLSYYILRCPAPEEHSFGDTIDKKLQWSEVFGSQKKCTPTSTSPSIRDLCVCYYMSIVLYYIISVVCIYFRRRRRRA